MAASEDEGDTAPWNGKMLNVGLDQNVGGIQVKTRSKCGECGYEFSRTANTGMFLEMARFWVCLKKWSECAT